MNGIPTIGTEIPKVLKEVYAHHSEYVDTPEQLAAIAGIDADAVQRFLADPSSAAELVAYKTRLEAMGELRATRTARVLEKAVARIEAQLDGGVDGFEAADLAKPLIRILENSERVRLAERVQDANANLPVFNFIFTSPGMTAQQVYPTAGVVDVAAKLLPTGGDV
jgi:hypothetical protein